MLSCVAARGKTNMSTANSKFGRVHEHLQGALIGARILESADNYTRASVPAVLNRSGRPSKSYGLSFYDDGAFWHDVLRAPTRAWNTRVDVLDCVVFSEWIARVPGLYWRPESARLRQFTHDAVEGYDLDGVTLRPYGKSQIVVGGVGTLKLPPSSQGYRIGTVTMSANVSTGVPVLVSPDVWDWHALHEGALIRLQQPVWTQMPLEWSERFPSRGHPVGCLLLSDPKVLTVVDRDAPTQIHPFTIMSYADDTAEMFDFVFATGVTSDSDHRQKLEEFFESYKSRSGRQGKYLISADIADPLWDSEFASPQELSRANPSAASHLKMLERRVRDRLFGNDTERELLRELSALPDIDYLRRVSTLAGIEPSTWQAGGSIADAAAQFLARTTRAHIPSIIEALAIARPRAFGGA